jgi:hypothetical protein
MGIAKGYDEGRKAGKRLAKGKSAFAKQRGGQKILNDIWALQLVDFVDEHVAADDITVDAAVDMYRDMMARGGKEHGFDKSSFVSWNVFELDKSKGRAKLIRLYWRIKKGEHKIVARDREGYLQLKRFYSRA